MPDNWSRRDTLLIILALIFPVGAASLHVMDEVQTHMAGNQVLENVRTIAATTSDYQKATGRWFPVNAEGDSTIRVFPDPFHDDMPEYQNLDKTLLSREKNYGMVFQLVNFDPDKDAWLNDHHFKSAFKAQDPYLRILLDYGSMHQRERAILRFLQQDLNNGILAKLDDHLFVLDIRGLTDE